MKIATIGGGSSYTPELIEGFIKRHAELPVEEIWLVDCEEGKEKLSIVSELAKRMVEKAGVGIKIHATLNREEALEGADFVTTQMRVGLLKSRILDERIPISHGFLGQETNGAGGLFKALRTVPVILDICKDIERLCPNAWLINFTNPSGIITEAINRYSNIKRSIGLCNIGVGMEKAIAKEINDVYPDVKNIRTGFAGLNHMVFATEVYADGQDMLSFVLSKWGTQTVRNIEANKWSSEFLSVLGALPCSYLRYFYMTRESIEDEIKKYNENGTRAEVVKRIEDELFEIYKDKNLDVKPEQLEKRGGAYYSDAACNLINSIYNDKGDIQVVNTVNHGTVDLFGENDIVETSCVITKKGPMPVKVAPIPVLARGLVTQIKSFEIAAVEAAVSGEYKKALTAMMINPLVSSQKYAQIMLDEMLEAHKAYLPQFRL